MYKSQENLPKEELENLLYKLEISPKFIEDTVHCMKVLYMHRYLLSYNDFHLGELREILKVFAQPYTKEQKKQMRLERRKYAKLQKSEHDNSILAKTVMKQRKDEEKKRVIMKFPNQKLVTFLDNLGTTNDAKAHINKILEVEWDPEYKDFEEIAPAPVDDEYSLRMNLVSENKNASDIKKNLVVKMVGLHAKNDDLKRHADDVSEVALVKEVPEAVLKGSTPTISCTKQNFPETDLQKDTELSESTEDIKECMDTNDLKLTKETGVENEGQLLRNTTVSQEVDESKNIQTKTNDTSEADEPRLEKVPTLQKPRKCYCCKQLYDTVHFFYDAMCVPCGDLNYRKRIQTGELTGKVALVTGARVKIGFCVVLKLLRAGATVIATTRFPKDAAQRYSLEKDFEEWKDRFVIYGLDMRHTPSVHYFCNFLKSKYSRLDILINNAAQTLKRKPNFYMHLLPIESKPLEELPEDVQVTVGKDWTMQYDETRPEAIEMANEHEKEETVEEKRIRLSAPLPNIVAAKQRFPHLSESALLCQVGVIAPADTDPSNFPKGALDLNGEQIDYSEKNTWVSEIDDIGFLEFMEVQTINTTAPWILVKELKPLMCKDMESAKYVINVSAMEGKFYRQSKTSRHPHTNMSKAALNMLTRTCGQWLVEHNIYMNSVDTGFNTNELPAVGVIKNPTVPLDEEDGAARILDPIFDGEKTGKRVHSQFLKDYRLSWW